MRIFILEVCLIKLDRSKIINCVPDCVPSIVFHFPQLSKTILETMCHNKNVLYDSNLLVSVSKFGIDTTKNSWCRIGIVSIRKSWYRPSLVRGSIYFTLQHLSNRALIKSVRIPICYSLPLFWFVSPAASWSP